MATQYRCQNQARARLIAGLPLPPLVNGIDFLEVSADQLNLHVHFIFPLPAPLDLELKQVQILGGVRIQAGSLGLDETGKERLILEGDLKVVAIHAVDNVLTVQCEHQRRLLDLYPAPG